MMKPNGSLAVQGSSSIKASSINDSIYQAFELGAEWMFLMDVDQTFPPNTIPRLLESAEKYDAKILSVLYHIGRVPYAPVSGWVKEYEVKGEKGYAYVNKNGQAWKSEYVPLGQGVVEVDWAGSGGMLIHRSVVEAIGWPPFLDVWEKGRGARTLGHDVNFCLRAKEKGFKTYVDTTLESDHGKFTYVNRLWAEGFTESGMLEKMGGLLLRHTQEAGYWDTIWQTENLKNKSRDGIYQDTFKDILEAVPDGALVADLGCGPGALMEFLKDKKKCTCVGYDFSEKAVEIAKSKGFEAHQADFRAFQPNGDSRRYDAVISTHTIEHIEDDKKFLAAAKELCKPGGKLIVATPWREEIQGHFEHCHAYSESELAALLEKDFKNVEVKKNNRDFIVVGSAD